MNQNLPSQDWPIVAERLAMTQTDAGHRLFSPGLVADVATALAMIASLTTRAEAAERERDGMRRVLAEIRTVVAFEFGEMGRKVETVDPLKHCGRLADAALSTHNPSEPDNGE